MSLQTTLKDDMKAAMKARDKERLGTIRQLIAALKNVVIEKQRELTADEELSFLATQAKRRRESIEAFTKGDRPELADKERAELAVIETYLPKPLTTDEVSEMVRAAIEETGASTPKDMGKVMKIVMPKVKGRFPGKEVRPLVTALLG